MSRIHATATAIIDAPASQVYAIIADYRQGHPRILPTKYFSEYEVERGGTGAGTIVRVRMGIAGTKRTIRMEVSEPEPGHVLAERDLQTGALTTFTIEPVENGRFSSVTIDTDYVRGGIAGIFEKMVVPGLLRRIYTEELMKLESVASVAAIGEEALEAV